jgi:trehalose 6-phosphate phosphatase
MSVASVLEAVEALPQPPLVALDLDGTLASIVSRPELTRLEPGTAEVLADLMAAGFPVLVVSGRALDDLRGFPWPPGVRLAGSHGLELDEDGPVRLDGREAAVLGRLRDVAESLAEQVPGCWVEHKPLSVVLHTRTAHDRRAAAAATIRLAAEADEVPGVHQKPGHEVLELVVRPPSKVRAVTEVRAEEEAESVLFAGDDITDEEVFRELAPPAVTVKVGGGPTAAAYRLGSPADVVRLLRHLAGSRGPSGVG